MLGLLSAIASAPLAMVSGVSIITGDVLQADKSNSIPILNAAGEALTTAGEVGLSSAGDLARGFGSMNMGGVDLAALGRGMMGLGGSSSTALTPGSMENSKSLTPAVASFTPVTEFCHDPAEMLAPMATPVGNGPSNTGLGF